ncbi:MAG TPA: hypothetical protein VF171_06310 [Trueperaceae bacterium]
MLRVALIVFCAVLALLAALSLVPRRERVVPEATLRLEDARVTLYPEADPEAVWHFGADRVEYQPRSRETTLFGIEDGERVVAGETDFTIASEQLTIDRQDDLLGEDVYVHLVEADWDLHMRAAGGQEVRIAQREGKFYVPVLDYTGAGLGQNHAVNVSMKFDLTDYSAECEGASCYNEFRDSAGSGAQDQSVQDQGTEPGSGR